MNECMTTKIIEFDMGHRVPNHKSKCRNFHGHRYRVEASVKGPIQKDIGQSDAGMVMDFGDIKAIMMKHIHDVYDHGGMFYVEDHIAQEAMRTAKALDPTQNINMVDFIPTAENLAKHFYEIIERELQPPMRLAAVRVYETPNSWADYWGEEK